MKFRYSLRDKDRQKRLDDWTGGKFSEALQYPEEEIEGYLELYKVDFFVDLDGESRGSYPTKVIVTLKRQDVDKIPIYDEDDWNTFPAITPPEGIWMRVEVDGFGFGLKAKFSDGRWVDGDGYECLDEHEGRDIHFRPWDETERRMR